MEHSRSDRMSLLKLGHLKDTVTSALPSSFLSDDLLWGSSCHVVSGHMERPLWLAAKTLQLRAMRVNVEAGSLVPSGLQMTTVPADTFAATSGETQGQTWPTKVLTDSRQKMRDMITICCSKPLSFRVICYRAS